MHLVLDQYFREPAVAVVVGGRYLIFLLDMARLARVIAVDIPHHVTQRGNARQFILASDAERLVYLDLLRQYSSLHQLSLATERRLRRYVEAHMPAARWERRNSSSPWKRSWGASWPNKKEVEGGRRKSQATAEDKRCSCLKNKNKK